MSDAVRLPASPDDKPPGLGPEYGAQFSDPSVVAAYPHRAPYHPHAAHQLATRAPRQPVDVLELGCGSGDFTAGIPAAAAHITAVDPSRAMLDAAQARVPGDHVTWRHGTAEDQGFSDRSFDVVLCAESIHWMHWPTLFPRLRRWMRPEGWLVLAHRQGYDPAWMTQAAPIIARYSTNTDYVPYDTVQELTARDWITGPEHWTSPRLALAAPVSEVVESFHARNGFSRDRMTEENQTAFDTAMSACLASFVADDGLLHWETWTTLTWARLVR